MEGNPAEFCPGAILSWDRARPSGCLAYSSSVGCLAGRGLGCVLTARLERAGAGGREGQDGQFFPINESGFLGFQGRQKHLGDLGKLN